MPGILHENNIHYMVIGQWLIPSAVIAFFLYYYSNFKFGLLIGVIVTASILVFGNRFSLLVSIVAFVSLDLCSNKSLFKKPPVIVASFVFLFFFIGSVNLFLKDILFYLQSKGVNAIGVQRLVDTIFNYSHGYDIASGRGVLFEKTIDLISRNPLGYGPINGNNLLGISLGGDKINVGITYPHNFILEIILHFGVIGSFFILLFIIVLTCTIHANRYFVYRGFGLFLSLGLISLQLFTSSSYIYSTSFWLFVSLGLAIYSELSNQQHSNFHEKNSLYY